MLSARSRPQKTTYFETLLYEKLRIGKSREKRKINDVLRLRGWKNRKISELGISSLMKKMF